MTAALYDELPYRTVPIEWTAPERLALASMLHGGPRVQLDTPYRVLELGCADGANLLPMAWYRRHASFTGVDGAGTLIARANERLAALGLDNIAFVHADFTVADERLEGHYDFILAHGVLSWIAPDVRDAVLRLCARRLRPGGLLYLNYNTQPGWSVRGLVRELLLAQTASVEGLRARAEAAQAVCHALAEAMADDDPAPWRRLLANELRFARDGHVSYVAHEYLAPHNHAFWRSELLALAEQHGLAHVADADFDQPWAREDPSFSAWLREQRIIGRAHEDTVDLLRYRQLHSPIFSSAPVRPRPLAAEELAGLHVASCLVAQVGQAPGELPRRFDHPSGYEIEVQDQQLSRTLEQLRSRWPLAMPVGEAFEDPAEALDDLLLLHRNGLIALRCAEPPGAETPADALHRLEAQWGGYRTTALHVREAVDEQ